MAKHAHHGGSWKVAYADFMTSMFALFLVLWIVGADEETRRAVEDYFQGRKTKIAPGERGLTDMQQRDVFRTEPVDNASKDLVSINQFQQAMEQLRAQLNNSSEVGDDQIRFDYTADGVRISVLDRAKRPFFDPTHLEPDRLRPIRPPGHRLAARADAGPGRDRGAYREKLRRRQLGEGLGTFDRARHRLGKGAQRQRREGRAIFPHRREGRFRPARRRQSFQRDNRRIAIVVRPAKGEDPTSFRSKIQDQQQGEGVVPAPGSGPGPGPAPTPAPSAEDPTP